jgi:hypothetical protein
LQKLAGGIRGQQYLVVKFFKFLFFGLPSINVPLSDALHDHKNLAEFGHADNGSRCAARWEPECPLMDHVFAFQVHHNLWATG